MKRIKLIIFFGLALMMLALIDPAIVYADMVVPGTKSVSWCYEISNMDQYPDYVFFTYVDWPMAGIKVIKTEKCFYFYKLSKAILCAAKRENSGEKEIRDLDNFIENNRKRSFLDDIKNNPKIACSKFLLLPYGTVGESNPLDSVVRTLKIFSLTKNRLMVWQTKTTYTYEDGTSKTKIFSFRDYLWVFWQLVNFWYIVLPALSMTGIIVILFLRKIKK